MDHDIHIAGIVVLVFPERLDTVIAAIRLIPCATVHASSPDGKVVITLETDSARRIVDYMDAIRALPGVANVALVYQHAESRDAFEQEIET